MFLLKANEKHDNKYTYLTKYVSSYEKIDILCPVEGHGIFKQQPSSHMGGAGCPKCKSSKGELKIAKFLKENCVDYVIEHNIHGCVNINLLRFDFYLKDYNMCIEFNGLQHYKKTPFFTHRDGSCSFESTVKRDIIKKDFCEANNIPLLIIKYDEIDNIDNILREALGL